MYYGASGIQNALLWESAMAVDNVEAFSLLGCVSETWGSQEAKAEILRNRWGDEEPVIIFQLPSYLLPSADHSALLILVFIYLFTLFLEAGHAIHGSYSISLLISISLCMSCQYLFWIVALNRSWAAYWYTHRHKHTLIFNKYRPNHTKAQRPDLHIQSDSHTQKSTHPQINKHLQIHSYIY